MLELSIHWSSKTTSTRSSRIGERSACFAHRCEFVQISLHIGSEDARSSGPFPENGVFGNELIELSKNVGGLNWSMQHWLGVYSPGFQSPRSFAGVDLGAELPY
jgi:hypothetical protein